MDIRVLKMAKEDARDVHLIGSATPEFGTGTEAEQFYSLNTLEHWIRSEHGVTLAAKDGDKLAGFLLANALPGSRDGYINCLVTLPEYRGHGVASQLLEAAKQHLGELGCNHVFSAVEQNNQTMLDLMQSAGFSVGHRFRYVATMLKPPTVDK
jgi:ribosomal protein S18 acetylase RimI-like enzyme